MTKTLLAIENDYTLTEAYYVNAFIEKYDGEIVEMTRFRNRSKEEIFKAVSKCTDIAVQTCFISGSDKQLYEMVELLSKIKNPINVYIAYISNRDDHQQELYEYLIKHLDVNDFIGIEHHKIYAMSQDLYGHLDEQHLLMDFHKIISKTYKERSKKHAHERYLDYYKATAPERQTGRKVLVLGCTAYGKAFENLPIGQEVDELICDELLTSGKPPRGVWIMGNGEPIMLVNDHGYSEYKVVTKLSTAEEIEEIIKTTNISEVSRKQYQDLIEILKEDELDSLGKANLICETLKVPKRSNRQKITALLA